MANENSINSNEAPPPTTLDLDALYPVGPIAKWMRLSKRTVLELARAQKIPSVRLNERVIRFHPRTILAKAR